MKKTVLFAIIFLSCQWGFAQKPSMNKAEIDEYSDQIRVMVRYLEETFSFIGNPETTAQEKDIVFKESYAKIFEDNEVQIEDDLDDNRSTYINKDVQAYLKDIDFFYKDIKFTFKIDEITPQTNEQGKTYFKVSMMRTIGHNILGDSVNNTCKRFIEINIDPSKKDMKIASMYTTKLNETEELRTWWNRMSPEWKKFFGTNQFLYDSTEIKNVEHIYRDSIIVSCDSLTKTIAFDMPKLYEQLALFTKITDVDVSHNPNITSLDPLYELSDLQNLDCSYTSIIDISPIRNLNKINKLDISNTEITDISDLRYTNEIKILKAENIRLDDIEIIGLYRKLTSLSLAGTDVEDVSAIGYCDWLADLNLSGTKLTSLDSVVLPNTLHYLNISNTEISDLTPLQSLKNLQLLIIDNTLVTDLSPIAVLNRLDELQCRNTGISDIMPLKDIPNLVRIYCDNTLIDSDKANEFEKASQHNVMVIYETEALQNWWNSLHVSWKKVFSTQNNTTLEPSPEELHAIISMKSLTLDSFFMDAIPVERLTNLERLDLENTKIVDLTPLHGLHNLKYLNIKNTKVNTLLPIENLNNLQEINIENTVIWNLEPLHKMSNLARVNAENSKVKSEQVFALKTAQPKVSVIYQTEELRTWWNTLDNSWRELFRSIIEIDTNPTAEQLQSVADIEDIVVDTRIVISSLEPLTKLMFLRKLDIKDNHVTDLSPLSDMKLLKELYIDGDPINEINELINVKSLEVLSIENTRVVDLNPVENMKNLRILNIANTSVKNIKVLANCTSLEELNIANTNVKTLAPVEKTGSLRYIKAFNTKVKAKEIDKLKAARPELNILYH